MNHAATLLQKQTHFELSLSNKDNSMSSKFSFYLNYEPKPVKHYQFH